MLAPKCKERCLERGHFLLVRKSDFGQVNCWLFSYYMLENIEDKFKCSLVEVHASLIVTSCIEVSVNMAINTKGMSDVLVITSLPLAMPRIALDILDVHVESFHLVYSLYRISNAQILNIRLNLNIRLHQPDHTNNLMQICNSVN